MIDGDIFPSLVAENHDILAIPLTPIFNKVLQGSNWPAKWKEEITTIIPKNQSPTGYGDCRNLSCTPLFSKVLESFMMDWIKDDVKQDHTQFGGIKKCSVEHFLVDSYDRILRSLEKGHCSVNLISIDYAKAFNRMGHQACLRAYAKKGASTQTLRAIASFLSGRTMRIKIGKTLSKKRPINGGSPQGCVSANHLFCTTIEFLQEGSIEEAPKDNDIAGLDISQEGSSNYAGETILGDIPSFCESVEDNGIGLRLSSPNSDRDQDGEHDPTLSLLSSSVEENGVEVPFTSPDRDYGPISPPTPSPCSSSFNPILTSSPGDDGEEDPQCRPLQGINPFRRIEDTRSDDGTLPNQSLITSILGVPVGWTEGEHWFNKYIDDGLAGEELCNINAITHISDKKEVKLIHASRSEKFLKLTEQNASHIGMKINTAKTKMLCVTTAKNSSVNTFIKAGGQVIKGEEELSILGYKIGREPTAEKQVDYIERRFYLKLWTLRNLKRAGSSNDDLIKIYECYIRPTIEYCSTVYHPLLSKAMAERLEKLQVCALRQIFGYSIGKNKMLDKANLKTLQERREEQFGKFARKTAQNPRFEEAWFPRNNKPTLRNPERYEIKRSKNNRMRDGHLNRMRALLNIN